MEFQGILIDTEILHTVEVSALCQPEVSRFLATGSPSGRKK
jgi:hypothetical protein